MERAKLKTWLQLEGIQRKFLKAIDTKNIELSSQLLCSYVSVAFCVPIEDIENKEWMTVAEMYATALDVNKINIELPMYKTHTQTQESVLDYDGREWYEFANMLAKQYGWNLEYIAELDVDDALCLIQEIVVEQQHEREWMWTLSPNSVGYDATTKKSKFINLPRPDWMVEKPRQTQPAKVKILKDHLPQGIIKRVNDQGKFETVQFSGQ